MDRLEKNIEKLNNQYKVLQMLWLYTDYYQSNVKGLIYQRKLHADF